MAIKINIILTVVGEDLIKGLTPLGCFFRSGSEQNKQISSLSGQQAVSEQQAVVLKKKNK